MMTKYKPYDDYKESGVEWLGKIPSKWNKTKLKYISSFVSGNGFPIKFQGYINKNIYFAKVSDINSSSKFVSKTNNTVSLKESKENNWTIIPQNSILSAKIGEAMKKNHRKINLNRMIIDNNMIAIIPNLNIDAYYLYYFLKFIDFDWFSNMGAIPSLNVQELKDSHSYFPILAEQIIIGKFLDKKTKEIDNIISRKEQLIERLEEYKKSVITEAVTKGKLGNKYLNVEGKLVDEIEMKDSGVEWIGEIPEYWSINKVKFNSIINPLKSEINIKLLNEVSFIPMEYLKEGYISKQDYKKTVDVYKGYTYFKEGDILLAKVTPCFENGNIAIANNIKNNIGFATTEVHVIRTIGDSNKYLFYLFQSDQFIEKGKSVMYGAGGLKRVSTEFLENFQFPRPNIIAQQILTEYIDMKINKIQILIKKTKKSIQKYKEYKKSLIFEAVTGKIDLRDYEVERSEENVR